MFDEQTCANKNAAIIVIGDSESSFKKLDNIILDEITVLYLSEKEIFSFKIDKKVIFIIANFYELSISSRYFLLKNSSWGEYQVLYLFTDKKFCNFNRNKMIYTYHINDSMNIYLINHNIRAIINTILGSNKINIDIEDFKVLFFNGESYFAFGFGKESNGISRVKIAMNAMLSLAKDINESHSILFNITAGHDLSINEIDEIEDSILKEVKEYTEIVFSTTIDNHLLDGGLFLDVWYIGKIVK